MKISMRKMYCENTYITEAVDTAPLKKSMFFLTPKLFILFAVFIFSKEATTHKV